MPRILSLVLLTLSLLVVFCSTASAQDPHSPKADAESHYQTAVRLFGEGRYGEALDEFDAAIALSPESIFFCNRAIVLIKLREPEAALDNLETCQRTHTGSQEDLAEIDAQRQAVSVVVNHVRASMLDVVSAINAPAVTDERKRWTRTETGIVFLGVGGAFLASAGTLDFLSKDLKADLQAKAGARLVSGADYAAREAEYQKVRRDYVTRQRIWIGLTAAGAAFTLTGAVLVVSRWLASGAEKNESVEVGVNPIRPGLFVRFRW